MKMKTVYKILLILLIIGISTLIYTTNKSLADDEHLTEPQGEQMSDYGSFIIDPSEALGGSNGEVSSLRPYQTKTNLFCIEKGQSIKDEYLDATWGCTAYIHASSECGEVWHELAYVAYYNTDQKLNAKHNSSTTHYEGQGAIWRICKDHNTELHTWFSTVEAYGSSYGTCSCGKDLYNQAKQSYKDYEDGTGEGFDVSIYVYECFKLKKGEPTLGKSQKVIYIVAKPYKQDNSNELIFRKVDSEDGSPLEKAAMKVSYSKDEIKRIKGLNVLTKKLTSDKDGLLGKLTITPKDPNSTVTLTFTETKAPSGYKKFDGDKDTVEMKITFKNGSIVKVESSDYGFQEYKSSDHEVILRDDKDTTTGDKISLKLKKWDKVNNRYVQGATIKIKGVENVKEVTPKEISSTGAQDYTINIVPENFGDDVKISIQETKVPTGYEGSNVPVTLTIKYNKDTKQIENVSLGAIGSLSEYFEYKSGENTIYIYNKPKGGIPLTDKLQINLHKYNVDDDTESVEGAEFNINLECLTSKTNSQVNSYSKSFSGKTDANGNITFVLESDEAFKALFDNEVEEKKDPDTGDVIVEGKPEVNPLEFEITITETKAPETPIKYKKLDSPIKLKVSIQKEASGAEPFTVKSYKFVSATFTENNNKTPSGEALIATSKFENSDKTLQLDVPNKKDCVHIHLYKKDYLDKKEVDGAHFEVTTDNVSSFKNESGGNTDSAGFLEIKDISPAGSGNFSVTLTEDKAPEGLEFMKPIKATWASDLSLVSVEIQNESGAWEAYTGSYSYDKSTCILTLDPATDDNKVEELRFKKVDKVTNEGLENFEFDLSFTNVKSIKETSSGTINGTTITGATTDSNGEIVIKGIILEKKDVVMTVTEKKINPKFTKENHKSNAENERYYYEEISKPVEYNIQYDTFGSGYKITSSVKNGGEEVKQGNEEAYGLRKISEITACDKEVVTLKDIPLMDLEGKVWIDDQEGNKKVSPANGNYDSSEKVVQDVEVFLYEQKNGTEQDKELLKTKTDGEGKYKFEEVECPRADFSGKRDTELDGYIVKFEYNGIQFEDTVSGGESKAFEYYKSEKDDEFARDTFNAKYKTITKDTSNAVKLGYEEVGDGNITRANLKGRIDLEAAVPQMSVSNPAGGEKDFAVRSKSKLVTVTDDNLSFGMIKRFFDLKIDMIINSATLTINNKQTAYSYDDEISWIKEEGDMLKDAANNNEAKDQEVEKTKNNNDKDLYIDLKLYDSDYRYRIQDYNERLDDINKLLNGEQKQRQEQKADGSFEESDREIVKDNNNNKDEELRVFVTYEVAIMNQSYEDAQVNELTYYFDKAYEFVSVGSKIDYDESTKTGSRMAVSDPDITVTDAGTSGEYKVIKVSGSGIEKKDALSGDDYRQVLYFTFEITRDKNGDGKVEGREDGLPSEIKDNGDDGKSFATIVEISSYSTWDKDKNDTEGGFIDEDSNPGNCPGQDPWEDDTYGAKALKVTICDEVRKIEGIVWDDTYQGDTLNYDKDGIVDPDDAIDGVVVQLIEKRNIPDAAGNDVYREAIWQQTLSGTNEVTTRNNRTGFVDYQESYTTDVTGKGKYKFEDFIPGDYIVRFIYGDGLNNYYSFVADDYTDEIEKKYIEGTFLDYKEEDNVSKDVESLIKKYNGQDYQSTIDARSDYQYNKQYYEDKQNTENYASAWDYEPRRLQVMAYSSTIDGELGSALDTLPKIIDGVSEELSRRANLMQLGTTKENRSLGEYFYTIFARENNLSSSGAVFQDMIKEELIKYISEEGMTLDEFLDAFIVELKDETGNDYTRDQVYGMLYQEMLQDSEVYKNMIEIVQCYTSEKTWMCSETSILPINISEMDKNKADSSGETIVTTEADKPAVVYNETKIEYNNVNCGLMLRPITKIELEKHITELTITPAGTGISPIVDARAEISDIIKPNTSSVKTAGVDRKLKVIRSFRDNRGAGFWDLETDVEELTESAALSVDYTYVIRNESEEDYLTNDLVENYVKKTGQNIDARTGLDDYMRYLNQKSTEVRKQIRLKGYNEDIGAKLGGWYYTRKVDTSKETPVLSRVEELYDYLNNTLNFVDDNTKATYSGEDFEKNNSVSTNRIIYKESGQINNNIELNNIIHNTKPFNFLQRNVNDLTDNNRYKKNGDSKNPTPVDTDFTKKVTLTRTLDVKELQDNGGITIPTYLSEIAVFSNAAGRRNMECTNENLDYVHSEDNEMVLDAYAYKEGEEIKYGLESEVPDLKQATQLTEKDEYWGEKILVTKPTGGDRQTIITVTIVAVSSLVVLGAGIVLIKKYALKKQ